MMNTEAEERLLQMLCCCGDDHTVAEGGTYLNVVQLRKLAEWPYMAAMNVLVPESKDYALAMAVVCDRCLQARREIKYAVAGRPGEDGEVQYERVPIEDLKEPEVYWPDRHPDM